MKKIRVALKSNAYDIIISPLEKDFFPALKKSVASKKAFIITDSNVAKLHLNPLRQLLQKAGYKVSHEIIPAGETGKSLKHLSTLYDKALKAGLDRKSFVIALGGGVVGDIAGFFAATYMRGIQFVQVPTTLLAMTDSSVGGKTAVNTAFGKNIAGCFYQPALVWINSYYFATLPERQIRNGMAEVLKYAFTFSEDFYDYLQEILEKGILGTEEFDDIIFECCTYKAKVVQKDEKEISGEREVLNFGHTLAHALETATGYKKFLHGEAVAIGMLYAAKLSLYLKLCSEETFLRVERLLASADLIFKTSGLNAAKLVALMKKDKKSVNSVLRFVLLKNIGKAVRGVEVSDKIALKVLNDFLKGKN